MRVFSGKLFWSFSRCLLFMHLKLKMLHIALAEFHSCDMFGLGMIVLKMTTYFVQLSSCVSVASRASFCGHAVKVTLWVAVTLYC